MTLNKENIQDVVNKYATCMEEIKLRTNAIRSMYNKKTSTLYPMTNMEFCALQLRKILEMIALANLVANKDDYEKIRTSFQTDWNAKRILETIEKINSNYFPEGVYRTASTDARCVCEWKIKTKNVLTKNTFVTAYDEISCLLHSVNPFNKETINLVNLNVKIIEYLNLITNLLTEHTVTLCNGDKINCLMNSIGHKDPSLDGKVSVHYFGQISETISQNNTY